MNTTMKHERNLNKENKKQKKNNLRKTISIERMEREMR